MKLYERKLNRHSGFSLAETLVALIIILLVSSVVAAGLPAAERAYLRILESANAQMFLSTTLTELRDELATASEIDTSTPGTIAFVNPITGKSKITFDSSKGFMIQTYLDLNDNEGTNEGTNPPQPLVSDKARTDSLKIETQPTISYNNNLLIIGTFNIKSDKTNSVVAKLENPYYISVIVHP